MASSNRPGLRVRMVDPPATKPVRKTNAERSKAFRQSLKEDPVKFHVYQQTYLERNRRNRSRILTAEEQLHVKVQNRLRQQRLRDKRKAESCAAKAACAAKADCPPPKTRFQQQQEEETKDARRAKWASAKRKERAGWSAQKCRRHREKSLVNYHTNKAKLKANTVQAPLPEPTGDQQQSTPNTSMPPSQTPGERKAVSRAKNAVLNLGPGLFARAYCSITKSAKKSPRKKKELEKLHGGSPSAKELKKRMVDELSKLKQKRSKASLAKRKLLLDTYSGNMSAKEPGSYMNKKSEAACAIKAYLEDISVDLPGKRSVDKTTLTQKKILPKRVKRVHRDFCKHHPQHKVSRATFYRHIPKHILTTKKQQHQQSLCEVCIGIDQKLDVLNKHLVKGIDGRDCLSEASLCLPVTLECINRNCKACGVSKVREIIFSDLKDQLPSESGNTTDIVVRWMAWEMVQRGKVKRRDQVEKQGTLVELIELLLQELQTFSKHLFVFRWQYAQYKTVKASIKTRPKLGLAVVDFAENFLCKHQDEVQSAYYGYSQVTVHPTVTFYRCTTPNCDELMTEYQVFLSDDLNHDASLAKTIMDMAIQHMKTRVEDLAEVVVFSDGCAAQYKSRLPMLHFANASGPVQVTRAYFGSRHGKSPCDATGGVVKRAVDEDILAREVIVQDAAMMYQHCNEHYSLPSEEPAQGECCKKHIRRKFFLVKPEQVDRSMTSSSVQTIPGTRSFHSVQGIGNDSIKTRKLSCFCLACLDQDETNCVNSQFVDKWDIVNIKRVDTPSAHQDSFDPSCPCPQAESPSSLFPQSGSSNLVESQDPPILSEELSESLPASQASSRLPQPAFFRNFYRDIQACDTYEQLEELVQGTDIGDYPLPPCTPKDIISVKGSVDKLSLDLKPKTADICNLFPIKIIGDGNCLVRCFSVLVYGTENHHQEMRCRVVHELVTNKDAFISGNGMGEDPQTTVKSLVMLQDDTDVMHHSPDTVTPAQVEEAFRKETMAVRRKTVSMGLWQIAAGANILNCKIASIYPNKGYPIYQVLYTRTVSPLSACQHAATFHIMSTTTRNSEMNKEHWVANHYVTLLPMSCTPDNVSVQPFRVYNTFTVAEVAVGEYYRVTWNGSDYIGRVDEIIGNTIFINMMKCDREFYMFPSKQDSSWEHVGILKTKVNVDLVPEHSTHRNLCYRLV